MSGLKRRAFAVLIACVAVVKRGRGREPKKARSKNGVLKDDFQSVLRSLSTLMFINTLSSHSMECESMLFVKSHIPNL